MAVALVVAALYTFATFGVPFVLGAWAALLLQPIVRRLQRVLRGRRRGAAAIVALLVLLILAPAAAVVAALVTSVGDWLGQVRGAFMQGQGSLRDVFLGGGAPPVPTLRDWADLANRYGASAWPALRAVAQTSTLALLDVVVFAVALYALASTGWRSYAWLARRSPLPPFVLGRFVRAFHETGRGLILGGGGTALVQGAVASAAYVAIGLPRAWLFGLMTTFCALVPVLGTGLVWVPLAIGLFATGDLARAVVVVIVGIAVHSLIDNFVRPVLTRHARLDLPAWAVLLSMLGGVATFGAGGVLIGPLLFRLAAEALNVIRGERFARTS